MTPPHRIFVLDDEPAIRDVFSRALSRCGHVVETCETAEEAIVFLESGEPFDLIITDFCLPGMDGLEFLQQIRLKRITSPAILISGNSFDAKAKMDAEGKQEGLVGFFEKPVSPTRLMQIVSSVLEKHQQRPIVSVN